MSTTEQREARAALDAARPAVARLDASRGTEDLAADLIEMWSAVESALRSLVGTTILTGQALIREARQRQLINFESSERARRISGGQRSCSEHELSSDRRRHQRGAWLRSSSSTPLFIADATSEFARPAPAPPSRRHRRQPPRRPTT